MISSIQKFLSFGLIILASNFSFLSSTAQISRQRISINENWRFFKGDPPDAKGIFYDVRPVVVDRNDNIVADTRANQTNTVISDSGLKNWILPSANNLPGVSAMK